MFWFVFNWPSCGKLVWYSSEAWCDIISIGDILVLVSFFHSNCLFLIWLHASCFKSCKLTRMTANNSVYRAINNCCFFSVSFQSNESSESVWEKGCSIIIVLLLSCQALRVINWIFQNFYFSLKLLKLLCNSMRF